MKKIFFSFIAFLVFAALFTGCPSNMTVQEFLKKYTEEAAIEQISFDGDYPTINNITAISSEDDRVVTFYLRNPENFFLTYEYGLYGKNPAIGKPEITTDADTGKETVTPYTFENSKMWLEQDGNNPSIIRMHLTSEFLKEQEKKAWCYSDSKIKNGFDLNGVIKLWVPVGTNNYARTMPSYSFRFLCNTEPPAVSNLTVLQYLKDEKQKYLLAFNMPDMSDIHLDIEKITLQVNGKTELAETVTPVSGDSTATGLPAEAFVFDSSKINGLISTNNGITFSGASDSRVVYFLTDADISVNKTDFKIELFDRAGLSSSAEVTSFSERLEKPTCSVAADAKVNSNDDGSYEVTFTAPSDNADAEVYFEATNGTLVKKGHAKGSVKTNLSAGTWTLKAWSHKLTFVDSEVITVSGVAVAGSYFVNTSAGNGGDGSRSNPFSSIGEAFNAANEAKMSSVNIILLSDASGEISFNDAPAYVSINGQGKYTLGCNPNIEISNGKTLHAVNLILKDSEVVDGGTLILTGLSHSGYNHSNRDNSDEICCITLKSINSNLFINNRTGSEITQIKYADTNGLFGHSVIRPLEGSNGITEKDLEYYTLANSSYYLSYENGVGVARASGIGITIPGAKQFYVELNATKGTIDKDSSNIFTCTNGTTLTPKVYANQEKTILAKITKIQLTQNAEVVSGITASTTSITVNPKYNGKYTLEIEFEYEGLTYSAQLTLNVEAK